MRYVSSQQNFGAQAGNGTQRMYGQASQSFEASARLIGKKWVAFGFDTYAGGTWLRRPGETTATLAESASADYTIFGSETNATPSACESNDSYTCATASPFSTSGNLAEVDRTVVVGIIPINLRGRLGYSLSTSLEGRANAARYLGLADSIMARVSATSSASAALTGHFEICSPNCSFGFGGAVDLTIVRATVAPTASGTVASVWSNTNDSRYAYTNEVPLNVRVLDGTFSLSIDIGFTDWTWNIYSWSGYRWNRTLWSDNGSGSCVDWRTNTACNDVVNDFVDG